jgi:hypothetical protein
MSKYDRPASHRSKVIWDPHMDPKTAPDVPERKVYTFFRACGTCEGTGRAKRDKEFGLLRSHVPTCSACLSHGGFFHPLHKAWGKNAEVYSHELLDSELESMSQSEREQAQIDYMLWQGKCVSAKEAAEGEPVVSQAKEPYVVVSRRLGNLPYRQAF